MTAPFDPTEFPLQCQDLTVRYGARTALDGVSLRVPRGGVYALLGRNGAGKSSLVRCVLGQRRPDGGSCALFGLDAWKARATAMARVGVVPEVPDLPPRMTAAQAASFCAPLYPAWDQAGVEARFRRLDLPRHLPVGKLSRGQQTQVALTLALANGPDLLVLDDPTLGLDAVSRRDLYGELLEELADRGTTVLVTTHDLAGIEAIADRVGLLREGRLLLDEDLESLKARFRRVRWAADRPESLLAPLAPVAVQRGSLGTEVVVGRFSVEGLAAAGLGPEAVTPMSLEDIFLALAGETVEVAR